MVSLIGFINATLLILLLSPFIIRRVNKYLFKNKNKTLKKYATSLSKIHMYFAYILLITAFIHGYMALGTIRLHTGYILWMWVLIQVILGNVLKRMKKPYLLKIHRAVGVASLIFLIAHLIQVN